MYTESQVYTEKECKIVSRGFHSEDELYSMQNSSAVGYFDHWNHIPYDCSYPQFAERPRIAAERVNHEKNDVCNRKR
nr:MAG TPA: hypothetical protein [Bacteriophage sp.]